MKDDEKDTGDIVCVVVSWLCYSDVLVLFQKMLHNLTYTVIVTLLLVSCDKQNLPTYQEDFDFRGGIYEGFIFNQLPHGEGILAHSDGSYFVGQWNNGSLKDGTHLANARGEEYIHIYKNSQIIESYNKSQRDSQSAESRNRGFFGRIGDALSSDAAQALYKAMQDLGCAGGAPRGYEGRVMQECLDNRSRAGN